LLVPRSSPVRVVVGAGALLAVVLVGCTSSDSSKAAKQSDTSENSPAARNPQPSVEQALDVLFTAEQRGDYGASYALLSTQGRREYATQARWQRRRTRLPAVAAFTVVADSNGMATATVRHEPALDAFRGLTPAQERQTWKGRKERGGWLLDVDPRVTLALPNDGAARNAAQEWAQAVQRCDQTGARSLQAVDQLFGDATQASGLCGSPDAVAAEAVRDLAAGPEAADIVAQYSTDALTWARTVDITQPVTFRVVLAPLGDMWKVIGVFPPSR
jgi:hypothetical protein